MASSPPSGAANELPPGFDAVRRMRYLFAGRASKVTPSGRLQSCILVVLVDAVLICTHRGGVHRYVPIEAIRSLTTFPRGWLLLNCSGPIPGQQAVAEPSKTHDLMLVLSVPQRLIEVLQRIRAARTGQMLHVSSSDQIPSLADFRLRPLESAPTHAPLRMWALAAAANTQNALDTLSAQLENSEAPGVSIVPSKTTRHALSTGEKAAQAELVRVAARGPPFPYAPCEWLSGASLGTLVEHSTSSLIMAVARFVPTREQQLAASGEGGPSNGTATVIFPLHLQVAAVLCFAHARFPHASVPRAQADVPSVTVRFLAPRSTMKTLKQLALPPDLGPGSPGHAAREEEAVLRAQQQAIAAAAAAGVTGAAGSGLNSHPQQPPSQMKPLRVSEAFMFTLMRRYSDKVLHIVSVQRQIVSVMGQVSQLPPVNTEGNAFWRNPRIALFGDTSHVRRG